MWLLGQSEHPLLEGDIGGVGQSRKPEAKVLCLVITNCWAIPHASLGLESNTGELLDMPVLCDEEKSD